LRLNDASRCGSGRFTPANSESGGGSSSWGEKVLVGSGGNANCTPCATHLFSGDDIVRASQSEKQAFFF
jgi:hypothetical protein